MEALRGRLFQRTATRTIRSSKSRCLVRPSPFPRAGRLHLSQKTRHRGLAVYAARRLPRPRRWSSLPASFDPSLPAGRHQRGWCGLFSPAEQLPIVALVPTAGLLHHRVAQRLPSVVAVSGGCRSRPESRSLRFRRRPRSCGPVRQDPFGDGACFSTAMPPGRSPPARAAGATRPRVAAAPAGRLRPPSASGKRPSGGACRASTAPGAVSVPHAVPLPRCRGPRHLLSTACTTHRRGSVRRRAASCVRSTLSMQAADRAARLSAPGG